MRAEQDAAAGRQALKFLGEGAEGALALGGDGEQVGRGGRRGVAEVGMWYKVTPPGRERQRPGGGYGGVAAGWRQSPIVGCGRIPGSTTRPGFPTLECVRP